MWFYYIPLSELCRTNFGIKSFFTTFAIYLIKNLRYEKNTQNIGHNSHL